jgi:hypothetical protein
MVWLALLLPVLACGCNARPVPLTAAARQRCEDTLSATLGGFPGFPSEDPRNRIAPASAPDDPAPAFHLRGVVEANGIRGIYDCEVRSADSGRTWQVKGLQFNRVAPEPLP